MMSNQPLPIGYNMRPTINYTPPQVFFVLSNQHFKRTGGIGSFVKAMADMANDLGWIARIVTDRPPIGPGKTMMNLIGAACISGDADKATPPASRFAKAQVDPARLRNFHRSLLAAQAAYGNPDLVLICTPEAMVGALAVPWAQTTKVVFYTHHENLFLDGKKRAFDKFDASYDAFLKGLLN